MSEPTEPLGDSLADAFDERELEDSLRRVERRLHTRRTFRRGGTGLLVLGGLASLLVMVGRHEDDSEPSRHATTVPDTPVEVEPLRLADGRALRSLESQTGTVELADGSRIRLDPGAGLRGLTAAPGEVQLALDRGRVRFDVRPGGPRRWTIHAGALRVEVLGTAFSVTRDRDRVEVEVHRGLVSVTTTMTTRRLRAGERLAIGPAEPTEPDTPPVRPSTRSLDRSAGSRTATPARRSRLAELLERADRAREAGDDDAAIDALRTIVRVHGASTAAPAAAITWARLEERRRNFDEAERIYLTCIDLAPPPALLALSYERLIRLQVRRGARSAAGRTLATFRARFPANDSLSDLEQLVDP